MPITLLGGCLQCDRCALEYARSGSHMLDMSATGPSGGGAGRHLRPNVGAAMAVAMTLCFFQPATSRFIATSLQIRISLQVHTTFSGAWCTGVGWLVLFDLARSGDFAHVPSLPSIFRRGSRRADGFRLAETTKKRNIQIVPQLHTHVPLSRRVINQLTASITPRDQPTAYSSTAVVGIPNSL